MFSGWHQANLSVPGTYRSVLSVPVECLAPRNRPIAAQVPGTLSI